ncbi:hypothetical protein TL16_g13091 [Triparma laevis f. inornata]|uniref:Uncharacterized protein n=2 Tax=Triparma laevis TaxID=1534972 RepID=A0A9W7A014_9STRA|nr:hypothetical protein TrLO_g796 [Triparma laevis f. longispina]GMH95156.1 hypothetical protein TL16_g13091 [Triparma laevis f. inornata]
MKAFLDALSTIHQHPNPEDDPTLDLSKLGSSSANELPSISKLLSHTPMLKAWAAGMCKMFAPFVLFAVLIHCVMGTARFWLYPKKRTRTRHLQTLLVVLLTQIIVNDDMYKSEYNVDALTPIASCILVSEVFVFLLNCTNNTAAMAVRSLFSLASLLLKLSVFTVFLFPPADMVDTRTDAMYKIESYGPGRPCQNGHTLPGLYYSNTTFGAATAAAWEASGTTDYDGRRTLWAFSGDSRTLFPFVVAANSFGDVKFVRRWVASEDGEHIAVDCHFPEGRDKLNQDVYIILHGLNGGSSEDFIRDFVTAKHQSVSCVMIGRGMMTTPVTSGKMFNGARTADIANVAKRMRHAMKESGEFSGKLIGVGYSMGGIVLSNYAARSGKDCALDAAVAIGGGIDMRFNVHYGRSLWLWQPFLARTLLDQFYYRYLPHFENTLSPEQKKATEAAVSVTDVDTNMVAPYNGYATVDDYYVGMSAASDFVSVEDAGAIGDVSIPLAIVNALDDPIVCEKCIGDPRLISQTGSGNIFLLLTKRGGHVGYPLGPDVRSGKWSWMSDAVSAFVEAIKVGESGAAAGARKNGKNAPTTNKAEL